MGYWPERDTADDAKNRKRNISEETRRETIPTEPVYANPQPLRQLPRIDYGNYPPDLVSQLERLPLGADPAATINMYFRDHLEPYPQTTQQFYIAPNRTKKDTRYGVGLFGLIAIDLVCVALGAGFCYNAFNGNPGMVQLGGAVGLGIGFIPIMKSLK